MGKKLLRERCGKKAIDDKTLVLPGHQLVLFVWCLACLSPRTKLTASYMQFPERLECYVIPEIFGVGGGNGKWYL